MINSPLIRLSVAITAFALAGCASYATPGRGANMAQFQAKSPLSRTVSVRDLDPATRTDPQVAGLLERKPLAHFPTAIAVARVQAPGYRSPTLEGWGTGKYSVVLERDIEKPEHLARLQQLPMVLGIAPINRLLLDYNLNSDEQLRRAAAQLHADILLIYTIDTVFSDEDKAIPITLVSLGLSPNRQVRVVTTASAVFMDTRNGYIYGVAEASHNENSMTNAWQTSQKVDATRRDTESAAFEKLVVNLEDTWKKILHEQFPQQ
jgi:hypothetical protein